LSADMSHLFEVLPFESTRRFRAALGSSSDASRRNLISMRKSNAGFPENVYFSPPPCKGGGPGLRLLKKTVDPGSIARKDGVCTMRGEHNPVDPRSSARKDRVCTMRGEHNPAGNRLVGFMRSWKGTAGDLVLLAVGWGMSGFLELVLNELVPDGEDWETKAIRLAILVSPDCLRVLLKRMNLRVPLNMDYGKKEVRLGGVNLHGREGERVDRDRLSPVRVASIRGATPESARVMGIPERLCSDDKALMGRLLFDRYVDGGSCDCRECAEHAMESLIEVLNREGLLWVSSERQDRAGRSKRARTAKVPWR
jgi:hypothetical protein